MSEKKNESVRCCVNSCKNHCDCGDYCSLESIVVGTHEDDPAMNQCTDCRSFENINEHEQSRAVAETYEKKQAENAGFWDFLN